MSTDVDHDEKEYLAALTELTRTKNALMPEDVLVKPANAVVYNIEEMKKKHRLSVAKLTAGLRAVDAVLREAKGSDTDRLLDALDQLEHFKKTLADSKLKRNLQYLFTTIAVLLIITVIVLAAMHFPPSLLFPVAAFAMGTTVIPSIGGVVPAFTLSNIALNALMGAGMGLARPYVWKYARSSFRAWRYDVAVDALETTIEQKKKTGGTETEMALHAQTLLDEIQHLKNTGNKSRAVHKLTEALEAVNAVLKNPTNIRNLEHVANIAEDFSPLESRLSQVYNLFVASLAPLATVAMILAVPMAAFRSAGLVANALASRFLGFVVPFSGMGMGPDSQLGFIFINNSISSAGEQVIDAPVHIEKTQTSIECIRSWLGYKNPDPALEKPQPLDKAIKTIRGDLKTSKVKSGIMRGKMQTFKEQFNTVAKDRDKPIIPSRNK